MKEHGRTIDKQSVDAMHVVEMHVDQIHMGYTRTACTNVVEMHVDKNYPVSDAHQILNRAQLSASWTLVSVSLACFGVRGYDAAF